jgi:tetratricopeptide (TPR) repeat protein
VASSGPALAVLYRVDSGERASYAVAIYEGFGRSEPPRRRTLSFRDRPLEWVRFGDLDADGDAELIAGGRAFVAIYGMARRAPRPGADEEGGATASPHPAREPGPFEAARDLLEIGLAAEAGEAYQDLLRGAATRDEAREAWWGIARAAARAGDLGRAAEAREEIARRFPEAATEVLRARLEDARARWAWRECLAALDALAARPDLEPQERAAIAAERAEMVRRADLAPAIDARFAEPPGEGSIFSDPQRVRWHKGRGDIEVRLGVRPADLPAASPFPPTCAGAAISWGGEPSSVSFEWKLLELEPGAVVRLGLIEGLPGALELAPREPPSLDRAAPPASRAPEAPSPPERLMVELGARPDDLAPGEATPARRHPVSVAAVLGGVRVGRSTGRSDAGFALDVWYRTTIEYVPDPPCARFEISEAAALETTGGPETARTIFRAELSLPAAFAPGPFLAGAFEPPDEPAGAPATLLLRAVRVLVPRTESAPPAPPSLPPPEAEFFRATALQASGRASEAALAYRRAAALSPFMEPAIFGEGLAAREAGDTAAAARAFASCARTIASAREEFRRTLAEMGQAGAAPGERLAALDAFLAVDPDDAWARSAAIEARRSVVEALDRELPLGPDSPATRRLERARLYLRARAPEKALGEAAAALAADPPPDARLAARALATRAEAEAELGDEPRAAIDFARARKADPEAPEPLVGLARLYLARAAGRPAGDGEATRARAAAERALDEAAALARERAGVLLLRSRARLLQGKLAPARADAEQAAALEPRRAECYEQLARIALQEGRRRDASAAAARAFDLGPLDPALLAALRGD